PGFDRVGQLACAIIIAVFYRQIFGYPEAIRPGIAFSSKRLLRAAIILYGLKLNIDTVLTDGLGLLAILAMSPCTRLDYHLVHTIIPIGCLFKQSRRFPQQSLTAS